MNRISRLPIGIIESILCLIPIQEAARTSILSKEWRYHWLKIPKLEFIQDILQESTDEFDGAGGVEPSVLEQSFNQPSERKEMTSRCKLFYAIYQILLMHQGPIHEFGLRMHVDDSCVEIDHILLHLSKKNTVKKLKLDLYRNYTLPSFLFSLHQLTDLYLNGCVIDNLPSFTGFSSLTTLNLQEVYISEKTLRRLLLSCPLLKRLTIASDASTIDANEDSIIANFMECLPVIEYLSVWFSFYGVIISTCYPRKVSTTLVHLKYLCVECLPFGHICSLPFLVLLIRSAPNLEKLKLEVAEDHFDDIVRFIGFSKLKTYSDISLEHLNELEITDLSDPKNGLAFVKLILAKSPVLKKVKISLWDQLNTDEKLQVSKKLLSFPCASPLVKVIIS
ncbi:F-box/FBD/LRR-repeat protein At1g13570-like [Bidens hawaiensis]|uniref:F-box/FBD/LRR-repeat protein At1g13570-like n=1 Tax=Bidens hawaiensis TaxID=980011 RepID=UPI00404A8EFA